MYIHISLLRLLDSNPSKIHKYANSTEIIVVISNNDNSSNWVLTSS